MDLEVVQALLPITLSVKGVKNFNLKLVPSIKPNGVVEVASSTVCRVGYVTVQADLKIILNRLAYIFTEWF
jgi:hypothetical protein